MGVREEVIPFVIAALVAGAVVAVLCRLCGLAVSRSISAGVVIATVFTGYFIYFFRDPERTPPSDESVIVAGADGKVMRITDVKEEKVLKTDTVRVSIFLSLFDVHVNRAPISGKSTFLGYMPGKRFFTYEEKSSEFNQNNTILIDGRTRCVVKQIVGPVCRRVVYWPDHDKAVDIKCGDRIGMMKFGSRLDMYFPKADVQITARIGEHVTAGVTEIGKITKGGQK
jgi:phosphatidylserine decarboxylase